MILAWIGAVFIGLALGVLGSGGSILTVPILVYLVGEPDKLAIAESLVIVGLIALAGSIPYALQRLVDWRKAALFGLPGMAGAYLGAYISQWISGAVQLGLFAIIMLSAAYLMLRAPQLTTPHQQKPWRIGLDGLLVGIVTGLVGVGGGFLIVPALVLLGGLPMNLAVGTSLTIIALKSASGFIKYAELLPKEGYVIDWGLVLIFALLGIIGSFLGNRIATRLPQTVLRNSFAVFLLVMGGFILWQNLSKIL